MKKAIWGLLKIETTGNTTLFDKEDTERKLTEMGDPLERLSKTVDFEMFRAELEDALLPKERKSNATRPTRTSESSRAELLRLQEPHQGRRR